MHHVIRMTLMQIHECIRMESRFLLHKYQLLVIYIYIYIYCCIEILPQPASGNNLLRVSAAAGQLSAAGTAGTKQQYGGCNAQEVKGRRLRARPRPPAALVCLHAQA